MKATELYDRVCEHPEFVGGLINEGTADVAAKIYNKLTKLATVVPLKALESLSWEEHVLPVLSGERDTNVLHHMTRVVGYLSRVDNWNASKLGELDDRHKGNYAVQG